MKYTFEQSIILFGGNSEERLVSVAVAQNLSGKIPEAGLWFLSREGKIHLISKEELAAHASPFTSPFLPNTPVKFQSIEESLETLKEKVVIIGLHGTEGEDGKLQKTFENAGVRFTGTKSAASAVAFDKVATKEVARKYGLPVVEEITLNSFKANEAKLLSDFLARHGKMVLKPKANGSSVGLFIVSSNEELSSALEKLKDSTESYIIEPFITGREITVGVWERLNGSIVPLPCSEVRVVQGRQFDYNGKYLGSGVEELTPAPITSEESKQCQELALRMHKELGCRGYTRTDMILTARGPVLLETNTLPGLSRRSFIPQQLTAAGENLRDFFQEQINLA